MNAISMAAALIAGMAPLAAQQPQHTLRLAPISGTHWYHVHQVMTYGQPAPGKDATQRTRFELFWEIEGSPDENGNGRVRDSIYRLRVADTGAGSGRTTAKYTYDSANVERPPGPLRSYTELLDEEATWSRDERGAIADRELPAAWRRQDERMTSPDLRRSALLRPMDLQLPESPVAVGSSWRRKEPAETSDESRTRVESEFTLVSVSDSLATIRERYAMLPVPAAGDPPPSKHAGTRAIRTYTLDMRAGRVVAAEAEVTIQTTLRGRPIHLRIRRAARAVDAPTRGALEPLAPPPLSARWDETAALAPR